MGRLFLQYSWIHSFSKKKWTFWMRTGPTLGMWCQPWLGCWIFGFSQFEIGQRKIGSVPNGMILWRNLPGSGRIYRGGLGNSIQASCHWSKSLLDWLCLRFALPAPKSSTITPNFSAKDTVPTFRRKSTAELLLRKKIIFPLGVWKDPIV